MIYYNLVPNHPNPDIIISYTQKLNSISVSFIKSLKHIVTISTRKNTIKSKTTIVPFTGFNGSFCNQIKNTKLYNTLYDILINNNKTTTLLNINNDNYLIKLIANSVIRNYITKDINLVHPKDLLHPENN